MLILHTCITSLFIKANHTFILNIGWKATRINLMWKKTIDYCYQFNESVSARVKWPSRVFLFSSCVGKMWLWKWGGDTKKKKKEIGNGTLYRYHIYKGRERGRETSLGEHHWFEFEHYFWNRLSSSDYVYVTFFWARQLWFFLMSQVWLFQVFDVSSWKLYGIYTMRRKYVLRKCRKGQQMLNVKEASSINDYTFSTISSSQHGALPPLPWRPK